MENFSTLIIFLIVTIIGVYADRLKVRFNPSGVVVCMIITAILKSMGLLPEHSAIHDIIDTYLVPCGICAFMFGSHVKSIMQHGPKLAGVFMFSAATVTLSAFLTNKIINIGFYQQDVIAMLTASYIGGAANFLFMSKFLEFDHKNILAILMAADNLVMATYFVFIGLIGEARPEQPSRILINKIEWKQYSRALAVIVCITFPILYIAQFFPEYQYLKYVILTVSAIAITNLFPSFTSDIKEAHFIGNIFFMLFFCAIGTGVNFDLTGSTMHGLLLCAGLLVAIHFMLLYVFGRLLLKIDMEHLIIASNACLGGSSTAVAFAKSKHWHHMITTAAIMGVIGYATANFIAISVRYVM